MFLRYFLENKNLFQIGLLHLISVPPRVEDLPFLLTPEDWLKLHSPYEELGHTPEEFR